MINQEFLSQCSDDQINKGVAWCRAGQLGFANPCEFLSRKSNNPEKQYFILTASDDWDFKPCTNPNDIMLIAFANNFLIEPPNFFTNKWSVTKYYIVENIGERSVKATSINPLRAICEVYILMMAAK